MLHSLKFRYLYIVSTLSDISMCDWADDYARALTKTIMKTNR